MRALETHRLVPGQRLIETELALRYGVGRNAVREALQWLAAQGGIAAIRHRSSAIRQLDTAEAGEVLDVAEAMLALVARAAAGQYRAPSERLAGAMRELAATNGWGDNDVAAVVGSAIGAYCPRHIDLVNA